MGHFVKNKKTFNAFIDRLINLNSELGETESDDHPCDNIAESSDEIMNELKVKK